MINILQCVSDSEMRWGVGVGTFRHNPLPPTPHLISLLLTHRKFLSLNILPVGGGGACPLFCCPPPPPAPPHHLISLLLTHRKFLSLNILPVGGGGGACPLFCCPPHSHTSLGTGWQNLQLKFTKINVYGMLGVGTE